MPRPVARDVFPHGRFLGAASARRAVGGFELAALAATVPEHEVQPHVHADAHFVLVLAGQSLSSARGGERIGRTPALVYNPPGTEHRDRFRGNGGRFVTLSISPAALLGCEDAPRLPGDARVLAGDALALALRVAATLADADAPDASSEAACHELLAATAGSDDAHGRARPRWLQHARERLHDESGTELSLRDVAAAAGVHPVHLARAFRRHFHCTPGDYLRRCRVTRAAALLASSVCPLSEIAATCGYCDQAHFSRSFRAAYGMAPRVYRAQSRTHVLQEPGCGRRLPQIG